MGIINCKELASLLKEHVRQTVETFDRKPRLDIFTYELDVPSAVYVKNKVKACEEAGIQCVVHKLKASADTKELWNFRDELRALSWSGETDGIIVQKPLPSLVDCTEWETEIFPAVDVDACTPQSIVDLWKDEPLAFIPATTRGIYELLLHLHDKEFYEGKHCVVIGRSELVGMPTALVCMNKLDMTITVCHSFTTNLSSYTKDADVLVSAVGQPMLITPDMVKPGSIVLDVGISRFDGKLCGDVCTHGIAKIADVTPVPGGMGLMTVACLLQNIVQAYKTNEEMPCPML